MPLTLADYPAWARRSFGIDFVSPAERNRYEVNATSLLNSFQAHPFYIELVDHLAAAAGEYRRRHHDDLLPAPLLAVNPLMKPYDSVVDKSYRRNVVNNPRFPEAPEHGWVTPDTWYRFLNDLIRTRIVVKFIDGPEHVVTWLLELARRHGLRSRTYTRERDEGYYAHHYYVYLPARVMDRSWHAVDEDVQFEISIMTQLQHTLEQMTHRYYEVDRIGGAAASQGEPGKWKWDFRSNKFRAAYLRHTLHLLESIILEARDQSNRDHGLATEA